MWISKKKWEETHKKIAGLEKVIQNQQEMLKEHMNEHEKSVKELKDIIETIKN